MSDDLRPLTPDARRRTDALSGAFIRLADGNEWEIPKPRVRFSPQGDGFTVVLTLDGTDGYADIVRQVEEHDDGDFKAFILATLKMANVLFRRNYEVTDEEIARIIQIGFYEGDPEGLRMRDEFHQIGLGFAPKREGVTSESP